MRLSYFKNSIAVFFMVIQCAIFGFSFIIIKKLIAYNCPTFFILGIRFFIGTITLFIVRILLKKKLLFDKQSVIFGIICGGVMFIAFSLQTYGANYTSSANNALFTGLYVVFVAIISMLQRRKITLVVSLCSLISLVGAALVSGFTINELTFNKGDVISIICGLWFAIHFILLEKYTPDVDLLAFTMVQLGTVSVMSSVISFCYETNKYSQIVWKESLSCLIFLGIISTALTYLIQSYVQTKISANVVSNISCLESVFAVFFSLLLGYAQYSNKFIIGFIFLIIAMILITQNSSQKNDSTI